MNKETFYVHEASGLRFDTMRMMDQKEESSYDMTTVVLWVPVCSDNPMIIIDWYFGEADDIKSIKRIADNWCASKTPEELADLLSCQDISDRYEPEYARCDTLLKALHNQAENDLSDGTCSDITITIGGTTVKFDLGGPQIEAMHAFISHLAAENFHVVDFENSTVTGNI